MTKFRYSTDGGSTWTVKDEALPYSIPTTASQSVIVEPIGAAVTDAGDDAGDDGMPQQSRILAHWAVEDIPAQAQDTAVATWTDRKNGMVARANTNGGGGPQYIPNRHNGLPALHFYQMSMRVDGFAGSAFEAATLAHDATIIYVMDDIYNGGGGCSGGSYQGTGQFEPIASPNGYGVEGRLVPFQDRNFTTMAIELGGSNFIRVNSGAVWQHYEDYTFGGNFTIGDIGGGNRWWGGRLCEVIVYQGALTQAEHIQLEKYLRNKRAQPMPWATGANYHVFDGDSITRGQGVEDLTLNYPYRVAATLGLKYGAWTNVAKGGWTWDQLETRAAADLDKVPALVAKPTYLYTFEWYNQSNVSDATDTIAKARTYLSNRVAANFKTVFGTSTDFSAPDNASRRADRATYDDYWDTAANRSGLMTAYVRIHTDANIGVAGSAASDANATYFNDGIHLRAAGYEKLAALFNGAGTVA